MSNDPNITRDEAGNSYFTIREKNYKLPKLNWQYEEQFIIALSSIGINISGDGDKKSHDEHRLFSEEGISVRKKLLPWLFVESSSGNYKQLTDQLQINHFDSAIEVYEVLAKEIEVISYFLSQAQPVIHQASNQKPESASQKTGTIKPQPMT